MAKQQKKWIDGRGQTVPASYVPKYDKARDRAVRHVAVGAQKLRAQMEAFMADAIGDSGKMHRIAFIEAFHHRAERIGDVLEQQVNMVAHQAIGMYLDGFIGRC